MTTDDIAKRFQCNTSTARGWAAKNGVAFMGEGRRKTYRWTDEDAKRFADRPPNGRPRKKD